MNELDLSFTRVVDVPRAKVWRCWTEPELLKQWFTPAPWKTVEADLELRPGGKFYTRMRGPEGEDMPGTGCFLEIVPQKRLVWTDALGPGFRPALEPFMTGVIELEDAPGGGTRYTARVLHKNAEDRRRHMDMGFEPGWNKALDQLVALAKTLP